MRKIIREQMHIGQKDICDIEIELKTRDEIPQLLRGLQFLYSDIEIRTKIFDELWKIVPKNVSVDIGRAGMDLWTIFVLGSLRLCCNWDYDKLQDIANNHYTLRQMLGHGIFDFDKRYSRQTLSDNIGWFTPNVLYRINAIVVNAGHDVLGLTSTDPLFGRCDSFVVETDVHFPTDINLLWDAIRKVLVLGHRLAREEMIPGWRQAYHNLKSAKKVFRKLQKLRDAKRTDTNEYRELIQRYIAMGESCFQLALSSFCSPEVKFLNFLSSFRSDEIKRFASYGELIANQLYRRCIKGETIPHSEKMFSLFEEHTEWIVKGKAGISQELGVRVGIVECNSGFVLLGRVMTKETDEAAAVPIIRDAKEYFPQLAGCSFDKGFHSPENQKALPAILDRVILPRKGKLDVVAKTIETTEEFIAYRRQHSAVESGINALENHGLDRCCDHGIDAFKRYIALSIVARNIQVLGRKLQLKLCPQADDYREAA